MGEQMFWQITSFPLCEHHIFLSHCSEDRTELVVPVRSELARRQIIPWLDQEDYHFGRDSRTALRDGLLRSRHIVFFVTPNMMAHTRGWCMMELAFSDLIQANLVYAGGPLLNYQLPLFYIDGVDTALPRTAWNALRDRGVVYPGDTDIVAWSVEQIAAFLHREQDLALDLAKVVLPGQDIHSALSKRPGLVERVTNFDPSPIP